MLKRIPFNNDLIPIGNEKHYEGQQVWSDGRVAYGNVRVPQMFLAGDSDNAGFWVNEQGNQNYKLCKKFLKLGRAIGSRRHGDIQCFPCWADIISHQNSRDTGRFYFPINNEIGMFEFAGGVVCISPEGKLLVYDNYKLILLQAGQTKVDTSNRNLFYGYVNIYDNNDVFLASGTQYAKDNGYFYIYDLINPSGHSELIRNPANNPDVTDGTLHFLQTGDNTTGYTVTIDDNGQQIYSGPGYIELENVQLIRQDIYEGDYVVHVQQGIQEGLLTLIGTYHDGLVNCGEYSGQGKITIGDSFPFYDSTSVEIGLNALLYDGQVTIKVVDEYDNNNVGYFGDYAQTHDARRMFQLSKITENEIDCFITAETPDRNQQGDILYSGTFDVHYEVVYDSGQGDVVVNNGVHVYDSNSNEIYRSSSNLIFAVNNGVDTFIGYGRIVYEENGTDYNFSIRINVNGRSGAGYLEYNGSYKVIHDLQYVLVAEENANGLEYYFGNGWQGPGNIQESNLTPVEYIGNWSINISGHSYNITDPTGNPDVTDGTKHFVQNGTNVTFNDGQQIYSGAGSITVTNIQQVSQGVYSGNYAVSFTGNGDISTENNLIVCDSSTPVAEYAGGTITFANGYQIAGTITTSNTTPIRWLCVWELVAEFSGQGTIWEHTGDIYVEQNDDVVAYEDGEDVVVLDMNHDAIYQDAGWIETTKTMNRSIKSYEITFLSGVQLQRFPQAWEIGQNAQLLLPSMDLVFIEGQQQTVVSNDPLGVLSPADWITWPGGVHSCEDHAYEKFVISQDGQKIWNNGNSENYSGIEDCFSLVYLKNKWK